jgi:hypothetical protein
VFQSTALIIFLRTAEQQGMVRIDYWCIIHGLPAESRNHGRTPATVAWEKAMPLFLIERQFAEELQLDASGAAAIKAVNEDAGVNWLFSFLSADRKKTYCLYEAPSAEAIREAARLNKIPADVVIEVSQLRPEAIV